MGLWTEYKKKTAVKSTDTFLVYDNAEGVMQVDGSNVKESFRDATDTTLSQADTTVTPWCSKELGYGILTKYYAGQIDGILYSSSGNAIYNFVSAQSGNTELQKKGTGYHGSGSERTAYLLCMLWMKYATKNSQKVFQGCTGFNIQTKVVQTGENVNYVVIPTAQANSFYVGTTVSIGDAKPIRYRYQVDKCNGKVRKIGIQDVKQQIYDYIAVYAMEELFRKKIGFYQCGALKNKGCEFGAKAIKKWVDNHDIRWGWQADIRHYYETIPKGKLKELLRRDVDNDNVIHLVFFLIDSFEGGLSIGSYLSQYLANYYMDLKKKR